MTQAIPEPQELRQYDLVLLGATGYTGKLTAEWITTHLPADLKWAIAGRNVRKLEAVAEELKDLAHTRGPAIEHCTLSPSSLSSLAPRTRLLITTVGPYMHHGEPVLAACAASGTHYLDCTGEVPWHLDMVRKYDDMARRTGAIMIPQCGLDSVPADMLAYALVQHVRRTLGAGTSTVAMTLYALKSGLSGGTAGTTVSLFEHYPLAQLAAAFRPFSLSPVQPTCTSRPLQGPGIAHKALGLLSVPELGGVQTTGPMATVDMCLVHRSWGLYASTDRPYGAHFRFAEYMRARSLITGFLIKIAFALGGLLLAFPPSRMFVAPLLRKFVIPAPGEGPSRQQMKGDFFSYKGLAIADTEGKEKVTGTLDSAFGGYETTALTLSAAASVLLGERVRETYAGRLGGGIVTPATLGDQYLQKLDEFGMHIKVASYSCSGK